MSDMTNAQSARAVGYLLATGEVRYALGYASLMKLARSHARPIQGCPRGRVKVRAGSVLQGYGPDTNDRARPCEFSTQSARG